MSAIALCCQNEPAIKVSAADKGICRSAYVLSTSVGGELRALEQHLKCLPYKWSCTVSAVDDVGAVGEPCGNGLIDIDHCFLLIPRQYALVRKITNCCLWN